MGMGISSSSSVGGAALWQQQRQNYNQLASALSSGNLDAAKQAYSALTANSSNNVNANSPLGQLGAALQSGDIGAAQSAFASMRSGHHHHQQTQAAASQTTQSQTQATTAYGTLGNNVNVIV
jgi:phosphatidate phosphatase APP1